MHAITRRALVTAGLVSAIGTGIYEARQASRLREENQRLQQQQALLTGQLERSEQERDDVVKRLAASSAKRTPRLPAPKQVAAPSPPAAEDLQSTNLYGRIQAGVKLTPSQLEPYLKAHGRNAPSLLAAYRTTRDPALLAEAMQKYPNDPQVAFTAAVKEDASPEERRQWLEAFKQSAPQNALADYLSALNYFKAGQTDQAVQELVAASGKPQVQDYFVDRLSDDEEAYLAAGYSVAEAKALGPEQSELKPNRSDLKQLASDMIGLAQSYRQAGDQASAQVALQMTANLGQRWATGLPGSPTIDQFLGFKFESWALEQMDVTSAYGDTGQTVQDRLNQIAQQKAALKELVVQSEPFRQTMADQDWIGYTDRLKTFGEEAALRWLLNKYGQK